MTSPKDTNLFPNILKIEFATTMSMDLLITTLAILAFFESQLAYAYDLHPLQDICVAVKDPNTSVFMNGKFCKDPNLAKVDDFFASGLNISGNAVPKFGIFAKLLDVNTIPGLNTLGISIAPSELITILEGTIYAGFLVPDTNFFKSRLFGDVFVIPQGLIHFQYNVGDKKAAILATFSQNPGLVVVPSSIFASAKGFQLDKKVIEELRKKFL
ncbi:hypothetical protein P3L10_011003 [Capsicum annuum]